jgi:hypothetical protein
MLWGLETGQRIAVLDTLAGSTSLTSTVVSQFHLRRVSYVGLGLVVIWLLSPVGGQSSFRQITFGPRHDFENTTYLYVAPGPQMWVHDGGTTESNLNSIFTATLLSSATQEGSPRDPWGHIKVPRVQHYEQMSPADDQGWYKTENGTEDTYSSLIGIPLSGIDSTDFIEYTATIEAMYFHLDCDTYSIPDGFQFEYNYDQSWLGNLSWNENTTERAMMHENDLEPFAFTRTWNDFDALNCTIETTYVEVAVSCPTYRTCSVPRMRRSHLEHPPLAYTLLGLNYRLNGTMWEQTISSSSQLFARGYLNDPKNPKSDFGQSFQAPTNTSATRLGQMLNTYWAAMNGKNAFTIGANEVTIWPDEKISWVYQDTSQNMTEVHGTNSTNGTKIYETSYTRESAYLARAWESNGTKRSSKEVFQAHWGWVVALMISSTVLITASLIPFYLRTFFLHGPDILMNISSLATRESTYLALPTTGTYLSASDRSRCLKDVRIAFRDVDKDGENGRLAIQQVEKVITPLKKGRKYV